MKTGIYSVIKCKLIRNDTHAEFDICSEKYSRTETVVLPINKEEINEINKYNYIVWFKASKARIVYEKCKSIEEAEKKLFQLQTYYSQGITL